MYPLLLTNFLTNIPIKSGNIDLLYSAQFETGVIKAGVKGAGVIRAHKVIDCPCLCVSQAGSLYVFESVCRD